LTPNIGLIMDFISGLSGSIDTRLVSKLDFLLNVLYLRDPLY
jgi:hypothetical protein